MKKHAYLILAHNQPEVLELLVSALDDARNDIYIHWDRKALLPPNLAVSHAGLFWIDNPIDVRWGHVSVVEAELCMMAQASRYGSYDYYHLLSGVDLPLKSQDYIHDFFTRHAGKEFVGYYHGDDLAKSLLRKIHRWHFFSGSFKGGGWLFTLKRLCRAGGLRLQECLGYYRHRGRVFKKGTQWVSVTDSFVRFLLARKEQIVKDYQGTFCSDEIFIQTELWQSPFRENIFDFDDEARGCMRMIDWRDNKLADYTPDDLSRLKASPMLFARKFNNHNLDFLRQVINYEE